MIIINITMALVYSIILLATRSKEKTVSNNMNMLSFQHGLLVRKSTALISPLTL